MKNYILFIALIIGQFGFSQTKLIAHKSHSGSDATFASAVENNLFDISESNFGNTPEMRLENRSNLDSVIYVSNDKIIFVTSSTNSCSAERRPINQLHLRIWENGRHIAANHILFKRNHSLDSIKEILKTQYNFQNDVEKVVFIGYDNNKEVHKKVASKKRKKTFIPIIPSFPSTPNSFFLVVILGLLSILVYFVSTVFSRKLSIV